ncbi:MAG: aminotransferase class V-fold PLP-dependent enzyme [Ignavibacteriaceae bacterium]|nr:aminotransferase class V-fold PLP-dependent enzyme [Ignavibacteriaceae bacterium]
MKFKPEDLYASPNKLSEHYSKFKVGERFLFTGHSHQAWPDCGFEAQQEAWLDAANLVDDKWDKVFEKAEEVKQGYSKLLGDESGNITLGSNTHELLIRLISALPLKEKPRLVSTDGEFHSIRRQLDRLSEEGIEIVKIPSQPVAEVVEKLIAAGNEKTAAVLVSSVFFNSGLIVPGLNELAESCDKNGVVLIIDAYHHLNVVPFSVEEYKLQNTFIVGGGYKYCQLGEGNAFLRSPKNCEMRPVITGWYSEFTALSSKKKSDEVVYGRKGDLFAGATYDPTSHYRAARVFKFFEEMNITTEFLREVSRHQIRIMIEEFEMLDLDPGVINRDKNVYRENIAGFLVLYSDSAGELSEKLKEKNVWTDYRGNVLRFGPAPYISDEQIKEAMKILGEVVKNI